MSYCPRIREDLLSKLYHYKHSLKKKKPITKLVNEAVEKYLVEQTQKDRIQNKVVAKRRASISENPCTLEPSNSLPRNFLCSFKYNCGEYGIIFYHIVNADSIETAENKIDQWLKVSYPGQLVKQEGKTYCYFGGEVAVKLESIEPLDIDCFINLLTVT